MPARSKSRTEDIDAISAEVMERFDAIRWKDFNSHDRAVRDDTRNEVLEIRKELMKVSSADPARAALIWDNHVPAFVPRPLDLPIKDQQPHILNGIELGRKKRRSNPEPFLDSSEALGKRDDEASPGKSPAVERTRAQPDTPANDPGPVDPDDTRSERVRMLLDGLNRQYLRADDKYHFRDKAGIVAFEAQDKKLLTEHDTPAVVSSMIDLAETRGWSTLKLTGSKDFRRQAWLEASLRDLDVTGYQPTKLDKARLDETRQDRAAAEPKNTISQVRVKSRSAPSQVPIDPVIEDGKPEPRLALTSIQDQSLRAMETIMRHRGDAPEAIAKARALADERLTSERLHVGTLVEIGSAPYQDRRGEKVTPFVTLRDDKDDISKVWGVDLPRALQASGAQPDQKVAVVFRGRQPVEVDVRIRNNLGEIVGSERKTVERNTWEVVQFDRLREEAKTSVTQALDRQNNPAQLKVFDPGAKPLLGAKPAPQRGRTPQRQKKRTI